MTDKRQWTRVAAYGVVVKDNSILLCRLSNLEKNVGHWTLPGGGLDFGEKPEAGLRREVWEETGLTVSGCDLITVDANVYEFADTIMHAVQIYYRAEVKKSEFQFEVNGTTDVCAWIPLEEVATLPHVSIVDYALQLIHRDK